MSNKSLFAVHKVLIGIGGEPKSVKRLRSEDLLIETNSAIQTRSFLLAKTFLNSPLIVTLHKFLNSCREARQLIVPQKTQTYAQVVKTLTTSSTTQTDGKITQIICPPLKLLQRVPKTSSSVLAVSTLSTEVNLLMSTYSSAASISETRTPIPTSIAVPPSIVSRDQSSFLYLLHVRI
ncbi:uncharacterized protein TNCV_2050371 [Trichonephila clavipes]|nr:uncharacterized protein TNCV_2050371 [Trichonephila clavipes]